MQHAQTASYKRETTGKLKDSNDGQNFVHCTVYLARVFMRTRPLWLADISISEKATRTAFEEYIFEYFLKNS